MSRWPDPVRDPLPPRLITEQDIEGGLRLADCALLEPEDPAFDPAAHGFVLASRAALIECLEILSLARVRTEMLKEKGAEGGRDRKWMSIGETEVACKVARRVINELRAWIPEGSP